MEAAVLALPVGAASVRIEPALDAPCAGVDLPAALSLLLADPSRSHVRQPNLIAWGTLALDGSVGPGREPPMADLPDTAWAGRFWEPIDHVPDPGENAVLSIFDVADVRTAWDVIVALRDMEAGILAGRPG